MRSAPVLFALGVGLVAAVTPAMGQDDCSAVLVPTHEEAASDYRLAIAMMKTMSKSEYERHKSGGGGSVGIPVVDGLIKASASYEDFQERVSQYATTEQFSMNEQDSRTFLKESLSDAAIDAWVKCQINKGGVAVAPRKPSALGFALRVDWSPPPQVEGADLKIELPQGGAIAVVSPKLQKVEERKAITEHLKTRASRTFGVVRKADDEVRVIVNIGGYGDDLLVRPIPATTRLSWADWLAGRWCGPADTTWTWAFDVEGPYDIHTSADGETPGNRWTISDAGPNEFRITNKKASTEQITYQRRADGQFELVSPKPSSYRDRPFHRCN